MGAGTPGCLETREVGNAPSSKQPGWNKSRRLKIGRQDMEIKSFASPLNPGAEWGTPMSPLGTPWVSGVRVFPCTHQRVPPSWCLWTDGPSPAAMTGPS